MDFATSSQTLCESLGFPIVEDTTEINAHFARLQGGDDFTDEPKPDPTAMGDNDVKNILYINLNPTGLDEKARASLKAMNKNLELNTNWLSLRAGSMAQQQITAGKLPSDMSVESQMKRGTYRAKVIDVLMQTSPWVGIYKNEGATRKFSVAKVEFHFELLTEMLTGMSLSPDMYGKFEKVLQSISEAIFSVTSSSTKSMFWVLMSVYTWDDILQQIQPTLRTIYFEASQDIKAYVSKKVEVETVNISLGFFQLDAIFNLDVFDDGIKAEIEKYLKSVGVEVINKPIDIDVDP